MCGKTGTKTSRDRSSISIRMVQTKSCISHLVTVAVSTTCNRSCLCVRSSAACGICQSTTSCCDAASVEESGRWNRGEFLGASYRSFCYEGEQLIEGGNAMADELATLDAMAQAELVRRGELKPIELIDRAIAR